MIHKAQIVGFRRKHARHSLPSQNDAFRDRAIAKVYDDLDLCIRQRRKGHGDVIAIKRLLLLADPAHKRKKGGMRHAVWAALDAIEAVGASVWELDTDRRSTDARQRDLMMREAEDTLARTRPDARPPGRPKRVWSDEQRTIMQIHWRDLRHLTNRDAVEAINASGVRCSVSQVIKLLGASGRALGPK